MLKKIKTYVGIEGVKIELEIPEEVKSTSKRLAGKVLFFSKNTQTVTNLKVALMERYTNGRGQDKKIEELNLGSIESNESFVVTAETPFAIEFVLPFEPINSEMDKFAAKNLVFKGLVGAARFAFASKSEYYLVAEAKVKGTLLNPFHKRPIRLI